MKCPRDPDVTMLMSSREGIEIDYCPECRGVWLDRGELDKIVERSDRDDDGDRSRDRDDDRWKVEQPPRYDDRDRDREYRDRDRDYRDRDYRYDKDRYDKYGKGYPKKKRKNFLSELFEFGD